jgi:hypothetical protein
VGRIKGESHSGAAPVRTSATRRARFSRRRPGRETENLENWKSDVLPGDTARRDFSFSEFQVSTCPKMHDLVAGEGKF